MSAAATGAHAKFAGSGVMVRRGYRSTTTHSSSTSAAADAHGHRYPTVRSI